MRGSGAHIDPNSLDIFQVGYVTTFVEGEHSLEIPNLLLEITTLDWGTRFRNPCILETTAESLKVHDSETDVVVEETTWDTLLEPPILLPLERDSRRNYMLFFRTRIPIPDPNGYTQQLPVFSVESERLGKNIQDRVAFHKTRYSGTSGGFSDSPRGRNTNASLLDRKPFEKGGYQKADYEECLYLLNRCLNDIESFGGKLNKYLKKKNSTESSKPLSAGEENSTQPPHRDELTECIRKIKYAFNMNQQLEPIVLGSAAKINVRLIKLVRWLDEICRNGLVADYPPDLVRRIVEPPLSESSIEAVLERLTPATETFWLNLGDAWNRSSASWENPLPTYVPHFKTMPRMRHFVFVPKQTLQGSPMNLSPEPLVQRPPDTANLNKPVKVIRKASIPRIRNSDHERYYKKIQERGGRLCFATVEHMKAMTTDIPAKRGELFEVLDDTGKDWWKLENYQGETGLVPRWKLRPIHLNAASSAFNFSPCSSLPHQPNNTASDEQLLALGAQRWEMDSLPANKPELAVGSSATSPLACEPQRNDVGLANWTPLVVYIPKEMDKLVAERTHSNPMLLMPYGQEQESKSRLKLDSYSTSTMTPPITLEKRSKPPNSGQLSGQLLTKYSHPHAVVACKPTILLETKQLPRF